MIFIFMLQSYEKRVQCVQKSLLFCGHCRVKVTSTKSELRKTSATCTKVNTFCRKPQLSECKANMLAFLASLRSEATRGREVREAAHLLRHLRQIFRGETEFVGMKRIMVHLLIVFCVATATAQTCPEKKVTAERLPDLITPRHGHSIFVAFSAPSTNGRNSTTPSGLTI